MDFCRKITGAFLGLCLLAGSAQATTMTMKVMLDPFKIVAAEINVPSEVDCEISGSYSQIRTCDTPDANLVLNLTGDTQTMQIEKSTMISTVREENTYGENYLRGYMMLNGVKVWISLGYKSRNGVPFAGDLLINGKQSFTLAFDQ